MRPCRYLTVYISALVALSVAPASAQGSGPVHGRVTSLGDSTAAITLSDGIVVEAGTIGWSSTTIRLAEAEVEVVSARFEVAASESNHATVRIALQSNTNPVRVGHTVRFEQVRLIPLEGVLAIETSPWGAVIAINGEHVGIAPWRGSLEAGSYEVDLSARGYEDEAHQVSVVAGATEQVRFDMTRATGLLTVTTEPTEANVWVDGETAGSTPFAGTVPIGQRRVRVEAPGYTAIEVRVDVAAEGRSRHVRLEPVRGEVVVESDGEGPYRLVQEEGLVAWRMNGHQRELGTVLEIPVGTYAVEWVDPLVDGSVRVNVREGERVRVFLPHLVPIEEAWISEPLASDNPEPEVRCQASLKEYFDAVSSHYNAEVGAQNLRDDAQQSQDWLTSGLSAVNDRLLIGVDEAVGELVRRCPAHTDLLLRDGPRVVLEQNLHEIIGGGELGGLASLFASGAIEGEQRRRNPAVDEWYRAFERWFSEFTRRARSGY